MPSFGSPRGNVLYLLACGAPPAAHLRPAVESAQKAGWDVCLIATPSALDWIDEGELETVTGHAVRSRFRHPDEAEFEPLGDAVLVLPASFNTINKWAAGINDTLALGLLNEALGRHVPIVVLPWANSALNQHPAYKRSLEVLDNPPVTFVSPSASLDPEGLAKEACRHLPPLANAAGSDHP